MLLEVGKLPNHCAMVCGNICTAPRPEGKTHYIHDIPGMHEIRTKRKHVHDIHDIEVKGKTHRIVVSMSGNVQGGEARRVQQV